MISSKTGDEEERLEAMLRSDKSIKWHAIMARILLRVAGERSMSSEAITHSTNNKYFTTTKVRKKHPHYRVRKTRVRGETESGTARDIYIYRSGAYNHGIFTA